jgi:hypothetical protein
MKTLTIISKSFLTGKKKAAETTVSGIQTSTKKSALLMLLAVLLVGTTSCSRGSGYGCGTWPTPKVKSHNQFRSDSWPVKAKQHNGPQFANYKRYN